TAQAPAMAVATSTPTTVFLDTAGEALSQRLQDPMVLAAALVLAAAIIMTPFALLRRRGSSPLPVPPPVGGDGSRRGGSVEAGHAGVATLHYGDNAHSPEG